ncbi:NAD(P)H dehydrogenase [Chitinophaga lutea]|uniref:FMN dependent NADH:quinone oxidoreductase n=1 Tax=Chitinophaga lutea TaxID=2488634 RepID=A0A3N4Q979_9BACT|nr:NAD(P)H-dependent oxidoreductase [Chitinophaga lutea]RPE14101.1 NAD(P)H dehydrogenase [Chitinophaga lutea]
MKKILVINASVRGDRSYSRKLTQLFVDNWKESHPEDRFTFREVGLEIVPHIDERWIAAAFTKPAARTEENQAVLRLSNELVAELKDHDIYVLGTPMYNWSIPSGLKAYLDQVMRMNETWKFRSGVPDGDYVGLLHDKQLFILSSRGDTGYGAGEKNAHMNFQTSYLQFLFGIMGVTDVTTFSLDNEEFGGEIFERSKEGVREQILAVARQPAFAVDAAECLSNG